MGVENISGHPNYSYKGTVESQRKGGSGNGGDGVEARIAKLESDVKNIGGNLVLMWDDIREIRKYGLIMFITTWAGIIASALGLAGIMAKGFGWI